MNFMNHLKLSKILVLLNPLLLFITVVLILVLGKQFLFIGGGGGGGREGGRGREITIKQFINCIYILAKGINIFK